MVSAGAGKGVKGHRSDNVHWAGLKEWRSVFSVKSASWSSVTYGHCLPCRGLSSDKVLVKEPEERGAVGRDEQKRQNDWERRASGGALPGGDVSAEA